MSAGFHGVKGLNSGLVALALLLAAGVASADPRSPPKVEDNFVPTVEPEVWLRRLVGRYKYDGLIQLGPCDGDQPRCENVKGPADCVAIGTGPGVQCILNVEWNDIWDESTPGIFRELPPMGVSYLNPAMELFGMDPGRKAINHLLVNNKGLPEGGLGTIKGFMATFRSPCVNVDAGCTRIVRIEADDDARNIFMWIDIQRGVINPPDTVAVLTLRRVLPEDAAKEPRARLR